MDILNINRLKQIRDMQIKKLEELEKAGAPKQQIDNMKFAVKCTDRRIERAAATDYDESIANIHQIGKGE